MPGIKLRTAEVQPQFREKQRHNVMHASLKLSDRHQLDVSRADKMMDFSRKEVKPQQPHTATVINSGST